MYKRQAPGNTYDPHTAPEIDGDALRAVAQRVAAEELPPVNAFWSATLYENETGFFIPNDGFKYSVGENAGFKLDEDGGIRIVIAAEQPKGVPEENWLPINRADMDLDIIMRLYAPDLERYGR